MRRAARTDNSHAEIYRTLHQCGITVVDVSKLPNFCDALVLFRGQTHHVEIKTVDYASKAAQVDRWQLLTEGERRHAEMCEAAGVPYHIVFDADEALAAIGATE